jgi:hypothetical protein
MVLQNLASLGPEYQPFRAAWIAEHEKTHQNEPCATYDNADMPARGPITPLA